MKKSFITPGSGFSTRVSFGLDVRKSVFGVFDQVRLKPDCSATKTNLDIEIMYESCLDIVLCADVLGGLYKFC